MRKIKYENRKQIFPTQNISSLDKNKNEYSIISLKIIKITKFIITLFLIIESY